MTSCLNQQGFSHLIMHWKSFRSPTSTKTRKLTLTIHKMVSWQALIFQHCISLDAALLISFILGMRSGKRLQSSQWHAVLHSQLRVMKERDEACVHPPSVIPLGLPATVTLKMLSLSWHWPQANTWLDAASCSVIVVMQGPHICTMWSIFPSVVCQRSHS